MTGLVMALVFLVCAVLQTLVPPLAWLGLAKPPLLLSVVLYYALTRGGWAAMLAALLGGLLTDALSAVPLGYSSTCYLLVVWMVSRFRDVVLTESPVTQAFFGVVMSAAVTFCLYLLLAREHLVAVSWTRALLKIMGTALLALAVTPLVCRATWRLDRMVGNIESRAEVVENKNGFYWTI